MEKKPSKIINLAVLAHIDAGKTTLSERILFAAGEISHPGDVQDGLATMDYLPEEKEKGITIEAGISHFKWKDIWFNFIDAPGHIDFSAEVDTALDAVDGAILVVSATAGVETQTLSAWNKLRARQIPTLIFINKLDHHHSDLDETLLNVEERLELSPLQLNFPIIEKDNIIAMGDVLSAKSINHDERERETVIKDLRAEVLTRSRSLRKELADALSLVDDEILAAQLENKKIATEKLVKTLQEELLKDYVLSYSGSAKANRGIRQLLTGASLLFKPKKIIYSATLGKVIRVRVSRDLGEYAIFKSYHSLNSGQLLPDFKFYRIHAELLTPVQSVEAGDIYALTSSEKDFQLGDIIDLKGNVVANEAAKLDYQALLQTDIECLDADDWPKIKNALEVVKRMDPSCEVRENPHEGTWSLLTVGEVQQEVLLLRLQRMFGCKINASKPEVRYMERIKNKVLCENSLELGPHKVELSLNVENKPELEGIGSFQLIFRDSSLNAEQILAVDSVFNSAIKDFCAEGVLGKGELSGISVTLREFICSKDVPSGLLKRAFYDALRLGINKENIEVFEPFMNLEVQIPPEYAGNILGDLESKGAKIEKLGGEAQLFKIFAIVPLKNVFGYSTIGRSISKGTASYALRYNGYHKMM